MFLKRSLFLCILTLIFLVSITAQTHISVPLGHPVYHVIEQAQMRGLLALQPSVRPYSRARVLVLIDEILNNNENIRFGRLSSQEREILLDFRQTFDPGRNGLDLIRGTYFVDHVWNDVYFSAEVGLGVDMVFGAGIYPDEEGFTWSNESIFSLYFKGDLGRQASYGVTITGGFFRIPRNHLGYYNTFYSGYPGREGEPWLYNRLIPTFSQPRTFFPFTHNMNWDAFVWYITDVSNASHQEWPHQLSIGYSMLPELSGHFLNGHVLYRFARLDREWSSMTRNYSLVLNQSAQPFLAGEVTFIPFPWVSFSALTGVLEFHNFDDIYVSARTFQNAFSVVMLEFKIRNFVHFNFGSTSVWTRRFELGYLFPFMDNFLYQNNIGAFDNMALFMNLMGQLPGLGNLWVSFFLDEANPESDFFSKSRQMYAFQLGASVNIPWLPFASLSLSYTRNEPFNYSHNRVSVPWHGDLPMEVNYVNRGRSLGHYIPPNSDEFLIRLNTMPFPQSLFSAQYQLIRHGADYGSRAVMGSSLRSELNPHERSDYRKHFLRDGAYRWMHIFRLRGEYSLTSYNLPIRVFAEAGAVFTYFTDIDGPVNSGPRPFSRINTPEYPRSLGFIGVLGVSVFPKF